MYLYSHANFNINAKYKKFTRRGNSIICNIIE